MGFLRDNMTTAELAEGVSALLPPSAAEIRRVDDLAGRISLEAGKDPAALLHELFLLKVSIAGEYAMGMLERLGMEEGGIRQFHDLYTQRLSTGLAAMSQETMQGRSVLLMLSRMRAYSEALHSVHPEDQHLHVADRFTRFVGAPDHPELVALCLDTCKDLNRAFLDEIAGLSDQK